MDDERKDQEQVENDETLQDLDVPDESAEDIKGGAEAATSDKFGK